MPSVVDLDLRLPHDPPSLFSRDSGSSVQVPQVDRSYPWYNQFLFPVLGEEDGIPEIKIPNSVGRTQVIERAIGRGE